MAQPLASALGASNLLAEDDGEDQREVPVEHMDYAYVDKCTDWKYLKRILAVLKSGKEGRYFRLEEHTQARMLEMMPKKERVKWHALNTEPTRDEVDEAQANLASWLDDVNAGDKELSKAASTRASVLGDSHDIFDRTDLPPVRQAASTTVGGMSVTGVGGAGVEEEKTNHPAAAGAKAGKPVLMGSGTGRVRTKEDPRKKTFKEYYDSWDKFNVEELERKMDEEEKAKESAAEQAAAAQRAEIAARTEARRAELRKLRLKVDPATMPQASRTHLALREKQKGNEYFRSQDYEDAVLYYSRSLQFANSAVVLANRASGYLALKKWADAEADGDAAVALDPTYIKGWVRRAAARRSRGKYIEAIRDLEQALKLEPKNKAVAKLLREVKAKFENVEGDDAAKLLAEGKVSGGSGKKKKQKAKKPRSTPKYLDSVKDRSGGTRVVIEEISDSEDDDTSSDEEAPTPTPARNGSTRVAITQDDGDDSDSDSSGGEDTPASTALRPGSTRVAIVEDDDDSESDSDADEAGAQATESQPRAPSSTRVAIQADSGDDSDSDSEDDLPPPPDAVKRSPATATPVAPPHVPPRKTGTRVAIQADSGDDSDSDSEDDLPPPPDAVKRTATPAPAPAPAPTPAAVPAPAPPAPAAAAGKSVAARAEELRLEGNKKFAAKDLLGAAAAYTRCLGIDAGNVAALANRALVYLRLGRPSDAVSDCNGALKLWGAAQKDPEAPPSGLAIKALFRRALAYKAQGALEDAASDLKAVLAVEPANPRPAKELAAIEREMASQQPAPKAAKAAAATPAAQAAPRSPQKTAAAGAGVGAGPSSPAATASPMSAKTRQAVEMAEKAKALLEQRVAVPPVPRSAFAFQQACIALRKQNQPAVFSSYLKSIAPKVLKRLYKGRAIDAEGLSPLLSSGIPALVANRKPAHALKTLEAIASTQGIGMAMRIVPKDDIAALSAALEALLAAPKQPARAAERVSALRRQLKL